MTDLPDEVRQDPSFFRANGQEGLRDGCRVPLPWSGTTASYGFGDGPAWLPQPEVWRALSVEAQTGDPRSTLELYRAALRLRRELPGLGDGAMTWLEAPEGVLAFARPGFVCTANTTGGDAELPVPGRPVLGTAPVEFTGGRVRLPADSCVWWAV